MAKEQEEREKKIKELSKDYEKVCEKLEQLNERAFELEKELGYQHAMKEKDDKD